MTNEYLEDDIIGALHRAIDTIDTKNKSPINIGSFRSWFVQEMRKELKKINH